MAPRRTVEKARQLRRAMTAPEVRLWAALRSRPGGYRFRRQHPIGLFILDFYCPHGKLAIEIDGIAHDMGDRPARDEARDRWLAEQGIDVLRFSARDAMADLPCIVAAILGRVATPLHGPPPHLRWGG
ncbi:endonuclease domain-containing protein [Sphingomonas sp. AP4-R1]|nr:endonuclease domain-containing protein [Sphingomonas sp. AP4-R1]